VDGRTSPRPPRLYTQVPAPVGWISSEIYARCAEELPRFCCWEITALARKTESDPADVVAVNSARTVRRSRLREDKQDFVNGHWREDPIWLGDATFVVYVEDLAAGPTPLVTIAAAAAPDDPSAALARRVALTDAGRAVLDGREDRVRLNGIDRWLGGVHLGAGSRIWRWDDAAQRLI